MITYLCCDCLHQILNNMEKLLTGTLEEGREAYEAPKCEIIELQQEGVLCGSYGANNENYQNGDYNWSWN